MFLSQLTLKLSFDYFILNLRISHQIYVDFNTAKF